MADLVNEARRSVKRAPKALECGVFPPLSQPDEPANVSSALPAIRHHWTMLWENPCHEVIVNASGSESGGTPPHYKALKRSFRGYPSSFNRRKQRERRGKVSFVPFVSFCSRVLLFAELRLSSG